MIITQKATEKISSVLEGKGYLRVTIAGGGCSGYRIGLEKEKKKEIDDEEVSDQVLIDTISAALLSEAVLDWNDDPFKPEFKFDIPNTTSCGCGSSFQPK
jgi:iron-sulfur cluster assembly accessory protein|tara:strand:+ start:245 stop:544 length:300 start_codon:yes stop_codon:yes gene_type:complete